ncbi:hypothetical protein VOLCADRAFT_99517 [Volvox carteri f. nagariensis]|uniref:Uncharacterized protein n=1 Tax=Volvox carteri f. nagariensis TaxID=3068 RepID=D8UHZ3_VOLCA|nr:uncharacterized protein VOLCADRAFT_99517 [Volvox carteri f. nagariensis]EFJ40665.1 hypothetical protein VOLCADRAFT_99517 [Volvox carteri f. nagariensis]|eukprot:XP_002958291.1 hypothetical protein VOLCADRAFT_99517 [Volvox carteri f. nagariensis]
MMKTRSRPAAKGPPAKGKLHKSTRTRSVSSENPQVKGLQASTRPTMSPSRDFPPDATHSKPAVFAEGSTITWYTPITNGRAPSRDPTSQVPVQTPDTEIRHSILPLLAVSLNPISSAEEMAAVRGLVPPLIPGQAPSSESDLTPAQDVAQKRGLAPQVPQTPAPLPPATSTGWVTSVDSNLPTPNLAIASKGLAPSFPRIFAPCSSSAEERGCNYDAERVACEAGPLPSLRSAVATVGESVILQHLRRTDNFSVLEQEQQRANQRQEKPEGQPPKDCILDQIQPKGACRVAALKVLYGQLPQQSMAQSVPTPVASNAVVTVFPPNVETVQTNQHSAADGVELVRAALIPTDSLEDAMDSLEAKSPAVDMACMEAAQAQFRAEVEAEHLLLDATAAWHLEGNRVHGVILARRALEALRSGPHRAKYRSEVASSLADMLHAMNLWDEALDAVDEALQAAQQAGEWALAVKLSNNMGALYKELGRNVAEPNHTLRVRSACPKEGHCLSL